MNVMRQAASLVGNPVTVNIFAVLLGLRFNDGSGLNKNSIKFVGAYSPINVFQQRRWGGGGDTLGNRPIKHHIPREFDRTL